MPLYLSTLTQFRCIPDPTGNLGYVYSVGGGRATAVADETNTLIAAMTVPPDATRANLINQAIVGLKNAGIWSTLDVLYVLAAHDAQAARLNWKNPATFAASAVNSPTFTTDRGYAGDGATSRVDSTFNPTTAGGQFAQDSNHIACWTVTNAANNSADVGANTNSIVPRSGGTQLAIRNSNTATDNVVGSIADRRYYAVTSRSAAGAYEWYQSTTANGSQSTVSAALANQSFWMCGRNNATFSAQTVALFHAGASLTGTQVSNGASIFSTYLTAVGAI